MNGLGAQGTPDWFWHMAPSHNSLRARLLFQNGVHFEVSLVKLENKLIMFEILKYLQSLSAGVQDHLPQT